MRDSLADAHVNRFPSSFTSIPAESLSVADAIMAIRTGRYRPAIQAVRAILQHNGQTAYDKAKAQLDAYTFGGTFTPRRANRCLQRHSGLVCGDLDRLADAEGVKTTLGRDPHIVYAFTSPSGRGLKVGVHVPLVSDDTGYKHAWAHVAQAYELAYGVRWDPSGKDVSRLCFVSSDPTAYWNPDAEVFPVSPLPHPEPRAAQRSVSRPRHRLQGYAERAIDTAVRMIQSAELGTRHYTRLRAARLLGGYIAGGLLTDDQAYGRLAAALVGHTEDLERALKTVEDGLVYGKAHPITLEALEAERRAWLDQRFPHRRGHSVKGDDQGLILLPLRPYSPYLGVRKGGWHG
jgi:VirE N-terminal domain